MGEKRTETGANGRQLTGHAVQSMEEERKPAEAASPLETRIDPEMYTIVMRHADLNPYEMQFRQYYAEHPGTDLLVPHEPEEAFRHFSAVLRSTSRELLEKLKADTLDEKAFFDTELDVVIYQHLRYLPPMWHSHDFFEVMCVFWGSCTNHLKDNQLQMVAGDVCILRPGTRHAVSAFSDDCIVFNIELRKSTFEKTFFSIMEDHDILSSFFHHSLYGSNQFPYLLFRTAGDYELYDYLLFAVRELSANKLMKRRMVNNIIMAFFIILLRKHGQDIVLPELELWGTNEDAVYLLIYMQEHFSTVSLHELASFFHYSERQIQRLVKKLTGKTYMENIQDIRMRHAARMITAGNRTITEIAQNLGYSDQANFRTVFRRYYGMNPAQYRKACGQPFRPDLFPSSENTANHQKQGCLQDCP